MWMFRALIGLALAVFVAGSWPGAVSAASHGAATDKKEEKPAAGKAAKPAADKGGRHVGTVNAVDAVNNTLTVEEKSGVSTVTVTDKTTIKRGKNAAKLEDLKAGDAVTVAYTRQDGKEVASSITATSK
jgi:Cu/Ag efflux protein CusF